ncbi:MAG: hypothetical protein ACFB21_06355 [Opitutales bacterium]
MNEVSQFPDEPVRERTAEPVQWRIDTQTLENVRFYSTQPRPVIDARLIELDQERDVDQLLRTYGTSVALGSLVLGVLGKKRMLLLCGGVLGFLLQHGVQGWCPPLPALRKLGIRTRREINQERIALKALRGDFSDVPVPNSPPGQAISLTEARQLLAVCQ